MNVNTYTYDAFDGSGDEVTITAPEYIKPPAELELDGEIFELREDDAE